MSASAKRDPGDIAAIGVWFVVTRALVACAAFVGYAHPKPGYKFTMLDGATLSPLTAPFVRWDAAFYLDLARHGYPADRPNGTVFHAAFFPLYPMVVRAFDFVLNDTAVAALLVSNVCAFGAALLVARLGDRRAAILFLATPGAGFLSFPYSESLFCLLTAAGLLAVMRDRPWVAAAFGALASASRPTGVVVGLAILVDAIKRRRVASGVVAAALSTAGVIAYAAFCLSRYRDALYFSHVQALWKREFSVLGPVHAFTALDYDPDYYLVALGALAMAVWMVRRSPVAMTVSAWFLLLLPLSTGSLKSMIRFQGANVPLVAGATAVFSERWFRVVVVLSLMLLGYESFMYAAGYAHN